MHKQFKDIQFRYRIFFDPLKAKNILTEVRINIQKFKYVVMQSTLRDISVHR